MNHRLETRVSAFSLAALVTLVLMCSINQLATSPAPEQLLAHADRVGKIDWSVSVDSTINRAHQHATNLPRDTGGSIELQESARGAA